MQSIHYTVLLFLSLIIASCSDISNKKEIAGQAGGNRVVTSAERFSLERTDSCTILTIKNPWQGAEDINHVYYLVERGGENRITADPLKIIPVPVEKIICMSSTHLAMISALGEQKSVAGISGTGYVYDQELRSRIDSGLIVEIGYDAGINAELILKISPDIIMMYGIGSESAGYVGKVSELGIKVMYNADYLETNPLGKAEWIKLFGALYCKDEIADSIFHAIEASYNETKSFIDKKAAYKPVVLLGMPFRDTWFISPGNSYISKLIEDAGGNYLWKDKQSAFSMPYSFETVYMESLKADFWLNPGSAGSKREIASFDHRLKNIPCFTSGNIYNNTMRMTEGGGNDYWESGTLNPQLLLKDIASILHPGIFGDYELRYYRKVE